MIRNHGSKIECPFCESECIMREWFEDGHLVEIDIKCACGYHYSDAYGNVEVTYPEEESEN